jgi:sigma-B regulation protein RsbU (phosphoserine phosphatase)
LNPVEEHVRPKVLVVDDERTNLALLTSTLRNEGHEVLSASNGADALELAKTHKPDIVLLDILMPGMDGFEVLENLKRMEGMARVPVLFLTGLEDIESKLRGFSKGAVDYITKPFHQEEVRARLRIHLQLAHAQKALIEEQGHRLHSLEQAQKCLLRRPEEVPEARFSVLFKSREEAGGDLYDVVVSSDGIHGYFVADASGHDVGTSLVAAGARALLRQNATPIYSPEETFRLVNDALVGWIPLGKYLTASYARLNRFTGQLITVSAGHPPPLLMRHDGTCELLEAPGDVLGAFNGASFGRVERKLRKGDRLVLYTDGLVEDEAQGQIWTGGVYRLLEVAKSLKATSLQDLPEALSEAMLGKNCQDDLLVLAFEV